MADTSIDCEFERHGISLGERVVEAEYIPRQGDMVRIANDVYRVSYVLWDYVSEGFDNPTHVKVVFV